MAGLNYHPSARKVTHAWHRICSRPGKVPCSSRSTEHSWLPPALPFLLAQCWGRMGGEQQNDFSQLLPHPVQRAVCCGAASFFLTVEGLHLNFSGKLFTLVPFSPPLDSSAHTIVFSNSRCQNLGLG